jgi:hypothetical protein
MQSYYPAQGFVDHIVTPVVGMGWAIGEDAIDRYAIRSIENRTQNRFLRSFVRSALNPARSFANLMGMKAPWYRSNRQGPSALDSETYFRPAPLERPDPPTGVAPFEFQADGLFRTYLGSDTRGSCIGGGAGVGLRIAREWQIITDVSGCKMTDVPVNANYLTFTESNGDSLTYVAGPRWNSHRSKRWSAHAQVLLGGTKVTQENVDEERKRLTYLAWRANPDKILPPSYRVFGRSWDSNAFAIVTGGGVDVKLNKMLKLRTAVDYSHTWNEDLNHVNYRNSIQVKSGFVLEMGTW